MIDIPTYEYEVEKQERSMEREKYEALRDGLIFIAAIILLCAWGYWMHTHA